MIFAKHEIWFNMEIYTQTYNYNEKQYTRHYITQKRDVIEYLKILSLDLFTFFYHYFTLPIIIKYHCSIDATLVIFI